MIELERHIEILLLSNDCVIVPDLGGFMAHHLEAHYDEEDAMFIPPQRTLGFNPQLKLNDSLLAQSYVEAYDISYPEALRRIEAEVAELKQHLENDGYYELNDLGQLKINEEGKMEFSPCEAGILTPELYGLCSFEMKPITRQVVDILKAETDSQATVLPLNQETTEQVDTTETDNDERVISIKMSWIRNTVAVAAALLAFLLMTKPVNVGMQTGMSMSQINLPIIQKEANHTDSESVNQSGLNESVNTNPIANEAETPAEQPAAVKEEPASKQPTFCIVAASHVSQKGADELVARLQEEGYTSTRVYLYNNIRRVIIGSYPTEAEANSDLQKMHTNKELAEAWVYEVKK